LKRYESSVLIVHERSLEEYVCSDVNLFGNSQSFLVSDGVSTIKAFYKLVSDGVSTIKAFYKIQTHERILLRINTSVTLLIFQ